MCVQPTLVGSTHLMASFNPPIGEREITVDLVNKGTGECSTVVFHLHGTIKPTWMPEWYLGGGYPTSAGTVRERADMYWKHLHSRCRYHKNVHADTVVHVITEDDDILHTLTEGDLVDYLAH